MSAHTGGCPIVEVRARMCAEHVFERGGPYLIRGAADLIPTSQLLTEYSLELSCTIRNFHDVAPKIADSLGGNGYSLRTHSEVLGAANPYVYPDNLPRVNAHGGPGGKPCSIGWRSEVVGCRHGGRHR
jgi:ABC-type transporter Mla subunit MlaD